MTTDENDSDIPVEEENAPEILVVTFDTEMAAQDAVRTLNKVLRDDDHTIYQGALVSRKEDNELRIRDLRDMGLADIITGTAGLTFDAGRGGLKLTWSAVSGGASVILGGIRLAGDTLSRSLGLLGSVWSIPSRRRLSPFAPDEQVQQAGQLLEPGKTAVVLIADHQTAAELATDLARSGGEIA